MTMRAIGAGFGVFVLLLVGCGAAAAPKSGEAAAPGGRAVSFADGPATTPAMEASPAAPPPPPAAPAAAVAKADAAKESVPLAIAVARPEPQRLPQAGQLTAGVWDDNRNFDFFKPYATGFMQQNGSDFVMFSQQELRSAREAASLQRGPRSEIDVQLVLDTTGSMGDELSYLQGEFDAIAATVRVKFPNVTPRWSLVVYRDKGDDYVTRQFDFTSDTSRFRRDLRAQSAAGGGDIPEAVVQGLSAGLRQAWRQDDHVAKIAFWVADAPAHPGEGSQLANVVRLASKKGVHVYPIAASDTDPAAEYQMRSAAQMTGGRYVFLTNDSGIGNDHAEPHIPCYSVTRLDSAIVRMIQVELTGRDVAPESTEVLRSVGRPNKEGKCQLSSGMLVASS
jgi:hypothetical protein